MGKSSVVVIVFKCIVRQRIFTFKASPKIHNNIN